MNSKKLNVQKIKNKSKPKTTLDLRHTQHLEKINKINVEIESLEESIRNYNKDCDVYVTLKLERKLTDEEIDKFIALSDSKLLCEQKLEQLRNRYDTEQYYTDACKLLYNYYDLVEKGYDVSENVVEPLNPNSILNYFNQNKDKQNDATNKTTTRQSHASLQDQYCAIIDKDYVKHIQNESSIVKCNFCKSSNVALMTNDGYNLCTDCNAIEYIVIDHEKPSYKDPPKEISNFCYKRGNHLNEWILQIQGKETTDIPDEVYDKILTEFKKQRITNMASLTPPKLRQILKKLDLNKYYEHIPHIINSLNGLSNPNFEPELEEKFRNMFKQVQGPFLKYSPKSRKNFLSYSYVLHKFFQLLGLDAYLSSVNLLKSRDKLMAQDEVWKLICADLGWEFIPSL